MTKQEILQAVDKKLNSGVVVTCVKGTTDPESHTGYSWEYFVDVHNEPILDEDGYEVETKKQYTLCFYHCGNGKGCFGAVDRYDCIDEQQANEEMAEEARKAVKGDTIEFSDGTVLHC